MTETTSLQPRALLSTPYVAEAQPRPYTPRRISKIVGMIGAVILSALILLAAFPSAIAPYDPTELVARPFHKPNGEYLLGTNDIGQDLLSELIWGTRASLSTGLVVAFLAITIGTVVGVLSGYTSGILSAGLMRLADLTLVIPFLPLVILLSAYLGPSQRNVILILTLVSWAGAARLVRARVLTLINEPFIEAVRALGGNPARIITRHIWPGVRTIVLVQFILVASASILAEASLSFLGLGNPSAKSWGAMLYFARASGAFLGESWRWWVLPTGLMITLVVLSLVFIGYALEGKIEPGLRR